MHASRRNFRLRTDQKEFSNTHEKVYSEVDNRSGIHTIRTENFISDITRTGPKQKSMLKHRIESKGEIARKTLSIKPRILSA